MQRYGLNTGTCCAIILLLLSLCGCAAINPHQTALDTLLTLIEQRLALAEDVARSKWNSGAAVEDLARENEIVETIGRDAGKIGRAHV